MPSDQGRILLVGSVARPEDGWTVEDVFRRCAAAVGEHVSMLPDGELDARSQWIAFIPRHAYHGHPDIVTLSRHTYDDWQARGYDDQWRVTVREGVERVDLTRIGYAEEALRSWEVFRRLRSEGAIPAGVRFMVAVPLTESGTRPFVGNARDFEILWQGYRDALAREIAEVCAVVPHEDLAIQFDMARETAAVEGFEFNFPNADLRQLPADGMQRYVRAVAELAPAIPEDVWLGLHVCYGSLGHKKGESPDSAHYTPIRDLDVGVEMLNQGAAACGRRVDFVHMPVQFADGLRDGFYAPLERLDVGGARVYLGLIDSTDGVDGALGRAEVARRHLGSFGLGTACGWGRRPLEERVEDVLELERAVGDALAG
jgi:hypothetical protein